MPRHGENDLMRALREQIAERDAEIARLRESIEVSKTLLRERDTRLENIEALAKFHFGASAFRALEERGERIAELERELQEQREATRGWEEWAQAVASDLWRQTERLESLEIEVEALRVQLGHAVGA